MASNCMPIERYTMGDDSMIDKVIRMFNIINAIQANPGITANDLALKCDVNIRTIYRDIDALSLIAPVTSEGRGTGYRFIGNFFLYPLNFTEQEALAFTLLPSLLNEDMQPPGFASAYDKVMAVHNKEKKRSADLIEDIAGIIQTGIPASRKERKESPNVLQTIIQAIVQQTTMETVYHTQYRNETTERRIDPYYLVPRERRFYLIGYCHMQQAIRTFRISRFRQVELTADHFDKSGFSIKKHLKNTWSIEQGDKNITFKVRFSPEVARYIKEEELFVRPRMKDKKDGSMIFEVTVNNEREFMRWLLQYGPAAEVLEPRSVREELRAQLSDWMALYADPDA